MQVKINVLKLQM